MSMVDVAELRRLVAEHDALAGDRSSDARQRLRDIGYTIGVYTGEADAARAMARARELLDSGPDGPDGHDGHDGHDGRPSGEPGGGAATAEAFPESLLATLGDLAAREHGRSRSFSTLGDVLHLARVAVPDCVGAAVSTWHDEGSVHTLAAGSPQLLALERAQAEAGAGPLSRIRAQGEGQVVLRIEPGRPGRFTDRARRCGVRTVVAAHLRTHPHGCTAFSAYLRSPEEPGPPVLRLVAALALQSSIALDRSTLARTVADLLDRRHSTGLAMGVVMERYGVAPHTALMLLAQLAQRLDTDLGTVARRLAHRDRPGARPAPEPG
ncbi:ANTAR domain-containing protein [Kitasatospora sp. NPDC004723]|uniref:ANTAR domain-containing protein n=1 Tax=Kitasatospora sp. NPDC004723 TaxID=3154288 RepID=UPI00339E0FDA